MEDYEIAPIRDDQIARAFVLVQAFAPLMTMEAWRRVVELKGQWVTRVATDPRRYIRGVSVYSIGAHPIAGRIVDVPIFVVGSAANEGEVAHRLFIELRRAAVHDGCRYLRIWTDPPTKVDAVCDEQLFQRWDHGLMYPLDDVASRVLQ